MSDLIKTLGLSASGMQAQATRLRHVAENISNADTPGYRRKTVPFEQVAASQSSRAEQVRVGRVQLDPTELRRVNDPGHPLADETGHYDGSNVDMVIELADSRQAQRSYEANLKMFDQARQMSSALLDLLKR